MACTGGVEFSQDPYATLALNKNLSFHLERKEALLGDLGTLVKCMLEFHYGDYTLINDARKKIGWINVDVKSKSRLQNLYCVVVSRVREYHEMKVGL